MTYARDPYDTDQPPCVCPLDGEPVLTTEEYCPAHGDPDKPAPESPECPMEVVLYRDRLPCRLPRGHQGAHDYLPDDPSDPDAED